MPLAGPHIIQGERAVPISAERFVALTGRRPATSAASRRPAPPVGTLTPEEVAAKARAFDDKMAVQASDDRAARRERQLQRIARMGGPDAAAAKRVLAEDAAAAGRKAETDALDALPKTLEEAKGDGRALMKADMQRRVAAKAGKGPKGAMRESMERRIRASGREPVKR